MKGKYILWALVNAVLGAGAIFLYAPYVLSAFNTTTNAWGKVLIDTFKDDYLDIMMLFGLALLVYVIAITVVTLLSHISISKLSFKLSSIAALALPIMCVCSLKYDSVLRLWIKHIAPNIKLISLASLIASCGLLLLGIFTSVKRHFKFSAYSLVQAICMCMLLTLLIASNNWCGWNIDTTKSFGILMAVMPVYFIISPIILLVYGKNDYRD